MILTVNVSNSSITLCAWEQDVLRFSASLQANRSRSARSYLMKWGGPDCKGLDADEADAELAQIVKEQRMLEDSFSAEGE